MSIKTYSTDEMLQKIFCVAEHLVNNQSYIFKSDDAEDNIGLIPNDIVIQQGAAIHAPVNFYKDYFIEKRIWRASQILIESIWKIFEVKLLYPRYE